MEQGYLPIGTNVVYTGWLCAEAVGRRGVITEVLVQDPKPLYIAMFRAPNRPPVTIVTYNVRGVRA